MNTRYRYSYSTVFSYSTPVERHSFRLRYLPMVCGWQQPECEHMEIFPFTGFRESTDSQGNRLQWGEIVEPHDSLIIKSEGVVVQTGHYKEYGEPNPIYYNATPLTRADGDMLASYPDVYDIGDIFDAARYIMSRTYEIIRYVPGSTDLRDSAITSWKKGMGVCQDMSHIMIAVCRKLGMASRYVAGIIEGEGQTHAWVEVSDGTVWHPFDPTNNRCPETGYMKISHGRDATDCATVRGNFFSITTEMMKVECKLEKI